MPPHGGNPLAGMPGYAPLPMPVQQPVYMPGTIQTPAGAMASTMPIGVPTSLNALPTPDQIAPCAFSNHTGAPQPQYPYPPQPNYNTPWQQPPVNKPPEEPPKADAKPPETNAGGKPKRVIADDEDWNSIVYQVHQSLKSPDMLTRQGGAKLLATVLSDNPGTYKNPTRGQDAVDLSLKVLKDSRALVRIPLEVAFEVGAIDDLPKEVRQQLQSVQSQHGLFNFEPTGIEKILKSYPEPLPEVQAAQQPQRGRGRAPQPGGRLNVVSPA